VRILLRHHLGHRRLVRSHSTHSNAVSCLHTASARLAQAARRALSGPDGKGPGQGPARSTRGAPADAAAAADLTNQARQRSSPGLMAAEGHNYDYDSAAIALSS
jgi:hypothetical protein